ncbi:hypothetical protein EYR40_004436 [Pleurotus pulmonarius]|nr:hypothetical protein EYR40_004436 [Pleurotus pulmonarius]KAF4607137.1 hypothetical protein EYR38_001196 [Pleurotus pulmonarius]
MGAIGSLAYLLRPHQSSEATPSEFYNLCITPVCIGCSLTVWIRTRIQFVSTPALHAIPVHTPKRPRRYDMTSVLPPVLVVGAGPAGLVCALSLIKHGVPVRIIEKAKNYHIGTRGAGIMPRSLELLKMLGLMDQVNRHRGMSAPPMTFYKLPGGRDVLSTVPSMMEKVDPSPAMPFNVLYFVSQTKLEAILREELQKYGCTVELNKELIGLIQDERGVTAEIRGDADGDHQFVRSSYLIGADGGKGVTRKLLDLSLLGHTVEADGMVVGNVVVENLTTEAWHIWKNPNSLFISLRPYEAATKKFMLAITGKHEDLESYCTPDGVKKLLVTHADRDDIDFGEFEWLSYFQPNMRVVNTFMKGRVFLVGDAAHVHSPHGGQGLNTSIQDSFNLAWKMALVYKKLSPDSLLDTYNGERLPVIAEMLKQVVGLYEKHQNMKSPPSGASRGKELLMLDINYRWSLILVEQRLPLRAGVDAQIDDLKAHSYTGWNDSLCAGDRAPDAPGLQVVGDDSARTLFDLLDPTKHTMLLFSADVHRVKATEMLDIILSSIAKDVFQTFILSPTAPSTTVIGDKSIVDKQGHIYDSYRVQADGFLAVIVRPDGIIGAVLENKEGLSSYLQLLFNF